MTPSLDQQGASSTFEGALLSRTAPGQPEEAVHGGVIAAGYGRRDYLMRRLLLGADVTGILLALLAAASVSGRAGLAEFLLYGVLALPVWAVIFKAYGVYDRDIKRVSHTAVDDIPPLLHALLLGGLLLWGYYRLLPLHQLVLVEMATFSAVAFFGILGLRAAVRPIVRRRLGRERVALIGADRITGVLVRKIRAHPEYGLEPVGLLDAGHGGGGSFGLTSLGGLDDLAAAVDRHGIERIIISHTELAEETVLQLLRRAKRLALKVSILPEMFDIMGPSVEVDDVEGVTVLGINPPVLSRSSRALKRCMDLAGSVLLLIVLAPLLAAIALAVKARSKGPVFFRQSRIGRGGQRFQLVKFRTMVEGADKQTEELMAQSHDEYWLKLDQDPRITRVGRVLRVTSLDELPQLWNVVRGQMSLVGPRPLPESTDRLVEGWARSRLDLMPGITGSWQVLGRTNIPFEEMVKLDYLYVTNWSLWNDLRLILRTLPVVLTRRGAN